MRRFGRIRKLIGGVAGSTVGGVVTGALLAGPLAPWGAGAQIAAGIIGSAIGAIPGIYYPRNDPE